MGPAPWWPTSGLRYLSPVVLLVLVAQYLLGLWTNLYAPANGFTSNSSMPALDWHYNLGFALGILGILAIVFGALTRKPLVAGLAVIQFVGIAVAGVAGGAFVGTTPNPANESLLMGAMFLVSFFAALTLTFWSWMRTTTAAPAKATSAPA